MTTPSSAAALLGAHPLYVGEKKYMKNIVDEDRFDDMQMCMLNYIVKGIKNDLEGAGLDEEQVQELTGNIAFTVSCIIDSSTVMECEGSDLSPTLGFLLDDEGSECLISEKGSWIHEYVFGTIDEIFLEEEDDDTGEKPQKVRSLFSSDNLSAQVVFTYDSGVQVLYDLSGLMGEEFEIAEITDSHFSIIDPTTDRIERSTTAIPSDVSRLFDKLIEIEVIDDITDEIMKIDTEDFRGLNFTEIHRKVTNHCKNSNKAE